MSDIYKSMLDSSTAGTALLLVGMLFGIDTVFARESFILERPCRGLEEPALFRFLLWPLGCLGIFLAVNAAAM